MIRPQDLPVDPNLDPNLNPNLDPNLDLDLLELIHDVALRQADWCDVLECLKREFSARNVLLSMYGGASDEVESLGFVGGSVLPWTDYAAHFAAIDPFAAAMRVGDVFRPGVVTTGERVVPDAAFVASEFYCDWFRPNGLRHTAGAFVPIGEGRLLQLGLPRGDDAGPYGREETERLQRYFNHIRRAVLIGDLLGAGGGAPDFDCFALRHRLTPAESILVQGLVETGSLKRLSQRCGKSYHTLRSQLQAVFLKTGTRSQVDLIRLVHGGAGRGPGGGRAGTG